MALVRPSLNRTVGSAGEPGGELSTPESSCKRYLMGEKAFLGLHGWLGGEGGEMEWSMVDRGVIVVSMGVGDATAAVDMAAGDLRESANGVEDSL